MQKIKNVTQTVPYYLMPQDRPLTGSSLETIREPCPSGTALFLRCDNSAKGIFISVRV